MHAFFAKLNVGAELMRGQHGAALKIGAFLAMLSAGCAHGPSHSPVACGTPGGAVVAGTVADAVTGDALAGARVYLPVLSCATTTDAAGGFRFENVSSGQHRTAALHPTEPRIALDHVTVAAGDTVIVDLRADGTRALDACRALADCAPLLESPAPEELSVHERLRLVAYATGIVLAWKGADTGGPRSYVCVHDESGSVIAELGRRYPAAAARQDCEIEPPRGGAIQRIRHAPSGQPAFAVSVASFGSGSSDRRSIEAQIMAGGVAEMIVSHGTGVRAGLAWICYFRDDAGAWRAVGCAGFLQF